MPKNGTTGGGDPRDTRQRILDAARRLGHEQGYAGTTMAAISRESGVHPGSVYWHFKDKDATFAAVIRESYAADMERMRESTDPVERTLDLLRGPVADPERLGQWRFNALLLLDPRFRDSECRRAFAEVRALQKDRLVHHWVEQLPPDAGADLPAHLAAMALALVDGALLAAAAGEAPDLEVMAARLVHSLDRAVDDAWAASTHARD